MENQKLCLDRRIEDLNLCVALQERCYMAGLDGVSVLLDAMGEGEECPATA